MAISLITGPSLEPVTLAEIKAQLNVTDDTDDDLIEAKIKAARQMVERQLGQSLISTTLELTLDSFPSGQIEIAGGPILSVTSIKYLAAADSAEATLAASAYTVDVASNPARIAAGDDGWPSIYSRINAVRVRYVAGYGAAATDVPDDLREAVMQVAAHWYENREAALVGVSASLLPLGVQSIIRERRNYSF